MTVTRGLIIADPWIDHIIEGRKDWEMRSRPTSVRGWFGLIRKGSDTVVGLARLVECGKALNQAEMLASCDHHRKRATIGAHEFDTLCASLDIDRRLTPPQSPQTHGEVERFNGHIGEVLQSHHFFKRRRTSHPESKFGSFF